MGEPRPGTRPGRRVTLTEAAEQLGTSRDAVRMRVRRRSLASEKGEDGRVYVFLDASSDAAHYESDQDSLRSPAEDSPAVLVDELRDRIRYLERQVEEERTARYRADELLAQLMQRIPPQLEAPTQEPSQESPESATPQPGRVEPQAPLEEATGKGSEMHMSEAGGGPLPRDQRTPSERPWWRRMFGG
jgi:hypothetical protein